MKRRFWLAGALSAALFAGAAVAAPSAGSTITVQAMSGKLMKDPGFLGSTVSPVVRGDHLTFQEAKGDWYKVQNDKGQAGWINKSAVVEKSVTLNTKPGGDTGGATADEVALAGRGFSPEVEASYKGKHPELDYSHVDKIEKLSVDSEALASFAGDGKIGGGK